MTTTTVPVVLGVLDFERKSSYYPFAGDKEGKDRFLDTIKEILGELKTGEQPIFIRCGTQSPLDYIYFYPSREGKAKVWVPVMCDAKHTTEYVGRNEAITTDDQCQLWKAALNIKKACQDANMPLSKQTKLYFVTNRNRFATPMHPKTLKAAGSKACKTFPNAEAEDLSECDGFATPKKKPETIEAARAKARETFPNAELELLNQDTFEFLPFTRILFARLTEDTTRDYSRAKQNITANQADNKVGACMRARPWPELQSSTPHPLICPPFKMRTPFNRMALHCLRYLL